MKKESIRKSDGHIMFAIFCVLIIHLISLVLSFILDSSPEKISSYSMFWSPLLYTLVEGVLAYVLWWKAYRLGACKYTKIAVWIYAAIVISSLIYLICSSFIYFYEIYIIETSILSLGLCIASTYYLVHRNDVA